MVADHHAQRENEKENAHDPYETDQANQVASLRDKVAAIVRVRGSLCLEISSAYLAGKVESENVQDEDCPETENIVDHKSLIESCQGC